MTITNQNFFEGISGLDPELVKKVQLMKALNFFQGFSDPELIEIGQLSDFLKFDAENVILSEGEPGQYFWIILRGSVKVVKLNPVNQQPCVLAVIPCGECFGEMSIISGQPRTADIVANEDVFLYKVSQTVINQSRESLQLKFYRRFSEILVMRLARTTAAMMQNKKGR